MADQKPDTIIQQQLNVANDQVLAVLLNDLIQNLFNRFSLLIR
jgi:hypothetical protein